MGNLSALVSLLATATPNSTQAFLNVPSNLHVFHKYYSAHYAYKYSEKYAFRDKIWVFDGRNNGGNSAAPSLFDDLRYANERQITSSKAYRRDHLDVDFVDWSKNYKNPSLKDILRIDLGSNRTLFSPFPKNVYLEYSHAQTNIIPEYSFYFDGRNYNNNYANINFGKHKPNPRLLRDAGHASSANMSCAEGRGSFLPNNQLFMDEEGYDGICDRINIQGYNWSFKGPRRKQTTMWTTPYAAYRYFFKNNWNAQHYYYSLGDFVISRGNSKNLLQSSNSKVWLIDYDDVFALNKAGDFLKITLNESSEKIRKLNLDKVANNQPLANFLSISSNLEFSLSFNYFGKRINKNFTIKEILQDLVEIELPRGSDYFLSDFALVARPKNPSEVAFGNAAINDQKYYYKVNLDSLIKDQKLFHGIAFDEKNVKNVFPSELLSGEKLARYFYWVDKDKFNHSFDPKLLNLLHISGEVNDLEGTANLSYKFNGKVHYLNLNGMRKIPELSGDFYASDEKQVIEQLKEYYFKDGDYFWKNISFRKRKEGNWFDPEIKLLASFNPNTVCDYSINVSSGGRVEFRELNIHLINSKDVMLIPKETPVEYSDLSELFELNDYAISLRLTKQSYSYKMIRDGENSFDVLVSLENPSIVGNIKESKRVYTFRKDLVKPAKDREKDEEKKSNWWNTLLSSENIVFIGAGSLFAGSVLITLLKKMRFIKSR